MLYAINIFAPSNYRAALSMDPLMAQPSLDRAAPSMDGFGVGRSILAWVKLHVLSLFQLPV